MKYQRLCDNRTTHHPCKYGKSQRRIYQDVILTITEIRVIKPYGD